MIRLDSLGEKGLGVWPYIQGNHAVKAYDAEGRVTVSPYPKYPLYVFGIETRQVDGVYVVEGQYTPEDMAKVRVDGLRGLMETFKVWRTTHNSIVHKHNHQ
ncbi:hypothetical protein KIPB_012572, partial [Kipferlia bialata]|eukprot:g12572.t1